MVIRISMSDKEINEARRAEIPVQIISKMVQGYELSEREKDIVKSKNKVYVLGHVKDKGKTVIKPQLRNLPGGKRLYSRSNLNGDEKHDFEETVDVCGMSKRRWRCPECHRGLKGEEGCCVVHGCVYDPRWKLRDKPVDILKLPESLQEGTLENDIFGYIYENKGKRITLNKMEKELGVTKECALRHMKSLSDDGERTNEELYEGEYNVDITNGLEEKGLGLMPGISPEYYRPTTTTISFKEDREQQLKNIKEDGWDHIGSGVYRNITKTKNSPTGYEMEIYSSKAGKEHKHIICEKDGSISEKQAILRIMDVESGGDRGRRNLIMDLSENALVQFKKDDPNAWKWYMNPNKSDLIGIDTTTQDYMKSLEGLKTEGQKKSQRRMVILARSKEEEEDMRKRISQSFTQKEQKEMGLVFINVAKPSSRGSAGEYWYKSNPPQIFIDPKYMTSDTLIHELTHHHRAVSPQRKGALAHVKEYKGKDEDLEEAMTEAESITRQKPFDKPMGGAGYYHLLGGTSKERLESEMGDRKILTKYSEKKHGELEKEDSKILASEKNIKRMSKKNIRGVRAIKTVKKEFPKTDISKLKIKGKAEAIDTFWQYEKGEDKAKIHVYNPEMKDVEPPVTKQLEETELYEWRDGKKVRVN